MTVNTQTVRTNKYGLPDAMLRIALADQAGRPVAGRRAEIDALRRAGWQNPSAGRIYEGHINAAQLVARYGTDEQRAQVARDIADGHIFAVWNTQDADGVRLVPSDDGFVLSGAKTWASGAGSISRALITALRPDRSLQMCLVEMDRVAVAIDGSQWHPLGMDGSESFRVDFGGVALTSDGLIGKPDAYEKQPWFFGGALRFVAVQTGIVERIAAESCAYLVERNRDKDTVQCIRAAEMRMAVHSCRHWLDAGVAAWMRFDDDESSANASVVLDVVDMARVCVERAALSVIDAAIRSVGARGLIAPLPLPGLVRDLQMYLRQPAPDAALLRVGVSAFSEAAARSSTAIASSTGSIS